MQRVGGARRFGNPQSDRVYAIDDHGCRVNDGAAALASILQAAIVAPAQQTKGMPVSPPSIDEAELAAC